MYQAVVQFKLNHIFLLNTLTLALRNSHCFPIKGGLHRDLMRGLSRSLLTNTNLVIPWNPKWFVGWQGSPITYPWYMTKAEAVPKLTHQLPWDLPCSQMPWWEFFPDTIAYGLCIAIWRAWDRQKQSGGGGKWITCQPGACVWFLVIRWLPIWPPGKSKYCPQGSPDVTVLVAMHLVWGLIWKFVCFCLGFFFGFFNKLKYFLPLHVVREMQEQFRIIFK